MKRYQVLNQMNTVLLDNVTAGEAMRYAHQYMKMYPSFTYLGGAFYIGEKRKKKNLRLKIQEQA